MTRFPALRFIALTVALVSLGGCQAVAGASIAPAATNTALAVAGTTPTSTAASWQVYRGERFTISYPAGWTYGTQPAPTGSTGTILTLQGPEGDALTISEYSGYTYAQFQDMCRPNANGKPAQLAGLQMTYMVVEGVHRYWQFINSQRYSYGLSTDDGMQSQAIQAAHDQILATFKPDDPTPGCSS